MSLTEIIIASIGGCVFVLCFCKVCYYEGFINGFSEAEEICKKIFVNCKNER